MAWTPFDQDKFIQMCNEDASYFELALYFSTTHDKVKHHKSKLKTMGLLNSFESFLDDRNPEEELTKEEVVERSFSGDKMSLVVNSCKEVTNLDELIEVCGINPIDWDIIGWKCKAYQGFIKNATGKVEKTQMFSIAATMRAKHLAKMLKGELDYLVENALVKEAKQKMPRIQHKAAGGDDNGLLLVINPTDLHLGKFAWGKECGADYDTEIAQTLFEEAIEDLIKKTAPYKISKIIFTVGSDLLNSDNSENMTTGGTPQSTDGRQQRTIRKAWKLMQKTINRLLEIAPVHVVVVNGNHDRDSSFAVGEILSVAFIDQKSVTVDNTPTRRKYVEYGKCLIMFTHGDEIKIKDIPNVMAEEVADAWGRTLWRSAEIGHLHDQAVIEFPGVVVRRNPALTAAEDWHASKGFVGKIRTVHAQLWDREDGNIANFASSPVTPSRMPVTNLL